MSNPVRFFVSQDRKIAVWAYDFDDAVSRGAGLEATECAAMDDDQFDAFMKGEEIVSPLSIICPNQKYALLDDGLGELAFVSGDAWAAAHYHAHSL